MRRAAILFLAVLAAACALRPSAFESPSFERVQFQCRDGSFSQWCNLGGIADR